MGANTAQLQGALDQPWDRLWQEMADAVWPGAVTLVLPWHGPIAECLHPGGASLGLRVPACERARALLQRTGPLATTSANRSGESPICDPEAAAQVFPDLPCLGPLPWPAGSGQASTVLAWEPVGQWRLLRAGDVLPHGITP